MLFFYFVLSLWVILSLTGCNRNAKDVHPASYLLSGEATLFWNDIPDATSYNLYMSTSPEVTKLSGLKIPNVTNPVKINQLEPGKTYYFVVTVVNGSGESKESKELSYTAVRDKIGLIYWKNLFEKSIQDHKFYTAETRQEIKATPERTKIEAEKPPLENEALSEKIAGGKESSGDLGKENFQSGKERVAEPANIIEAEKPPLESEALSEKIVGGKKSSGDLGKENFQSGKERVAEPANIEEDLTGNSKLPTAHIETDTDPNLPALEDMRLKAAQMLADSVFYIFFEQNSNELSPKAIEKLDRIYEIMANNSAAKLTLNGYSDSIGSPSYNKMVSEIRANSVKSYLTGKGIKPSRMMAFGHGAQRFIASNKSAVGRRLNRRVEMELIIP